MMKKQINVVGAILMNDGKILCAQRSENMSLSLMWEFPGGKIEEGETPQMALKRELNEELLINVEVSPDIFETTTYEYDFGIVTLTTFICQLINGTPQLTEHAAIKWLKRNELETLNWAPADIPAVKKLALD
ncbi:(deoxy)nucleoside triphosphate pyrophosphohydrolase [Vagococcus xieshaowenii]|uniref:8-oxo-dGTP diphosphatase n=2 Tax=Vagococcus xieshaowenii TaxID=2562451 RepID=A0AAJ5EDX6_9ENTE|nr:(deoxy)nucleoside triphosphate pyrophosphohydrolase [Vagococcus xieshaowenii]TFZ39369.1 (deoxy)nucleoside triphosphate pyrophosphohydrolase [Vagococcus xieshaowenii]